MDACYPLLLLGALDTNLFISWRNHMDMLTSPDFLKVFLPLAGGVVAWLANEHRKRVWEEYKRKEEKYLALLAAIKGGAKRGQPLSSKYFLAFRSTTQYSVGYGSSLAY